MNGYLIQNERGRYLAQGLWWYDDHKKPEDAHVFPSRILEVIKTVNWHGEFPHWAIPARYTPEEGVVVTGKRFRI